MILQQVRDTSAKIAKIATHCIINPSKLKEFSQEIKDFQQIVWDNENCHFFDKNDEELSAKYILVLSSLNFCFWPGVTRNGQKEEFEYHNLAGGLKKVILDDSKAFDSDRLIQMDDASLTQWFDGLVLPQHSERVRLLREIGYNLKGSIKQMIESANKSCVALVDKILQLFPGFRDHSIYDGNQVFFYKRAQICVADIYGSFGGKGLGEFHDISELTMFADYRVPQILYHLGVVDYSKSLREKSRCNCLLIPLVENLEEVLPGSREEIEIRAATIHCVELLKGEKTSRQVDWYLWQKGESIKDSIFPHHRTRTIYY